MNIMEKVCERYGEILSTTEYGLFHKLLGNRKIDEHHVMRLMDSMSQKQLIVPIIVNENLEIIDGQHRFEACRRLGLPIFYIGIEGYRLEECHILNANNRTYSIRDFLEGYAQLGYDEYKKVKEFSTKYPFLSLHLCQIYLTGGVRKDKQSDFKSGNFKISDYSLACLWAERTFDFQQYSLKFFTNRNFNTALLRFYRHPKYDHKRMLQKIAYASGMLKHQPKEKLFVENLCELYNFKARGEDEKIYPHELYAKGL